MSRPSLIALAGITKSYRKEELAVDILKGIDLTIDSGEFVALLGPSGSGKSTLMHILGLLDRPSGGAYRLDGEDVSALDDDRLSALRNQKIGFIFQTFYLIPYLTALENVVLPGLYGPQGGQAIRDRARFLLAQVGLGDRLDFRPGQLSGGQQQRVAIARALLNDPQVLLADEPTGQLDSTTSAEIMELIASINRQGRTVIVVTHDPATAACAQRRIRLHDGLVVAD